MSELAEVIDENGVATLEGPCEKVLKEISNEDAVAGLVVSGVVAAMHEAGVNEVELSLDSIGENMDDRPMRLVVDDSTGKGILKFLDVEDKEVEE